MMWLQKTNKERLATIEGAIINIDKNVDEIKIDNKEQQKQINLNAQNISGMKAVSGFISGSVSLVIAGIITYFGAKHRWIS